MSDIEWAVAHILKTKYPQIHHEIMVAACEHAGFIAPGSDPDCPVPAVTTQPAAVSDQNHTEDPHQ